MDIKFVIEFPLASNFLGTAVIIILVITGTIPPPKNNTNHIAIRKARILLNKGTIIANKQAKTPRIKQNIKLFVISFLQNAFFVNVPTNTPRVGDVKHTKVK